MTDKTSAPEPKVYTSPQRKLVKFFEKSRNQWKTKCLEAKATIRRLKNRAQWLEQSRDRWKARARQLAQRVRELETETGPSPAPPPKKTPLVPSSRPSSALSCSRGRRTTIIP